MAPITEKLVPSAKYRIPFERRVKGLNIDRNFRTSGKESTGYRALLMKKRGMLSRVRIDCIPSG